MSHVYSKESREKRIIQSTQSLLIMPTVGEFSALMYESDWVKRYAPLYNKKLRRSKSLFTIEFKAEDQSGYWQAHVKAMNDVTRCFNDQHFGLFLRRDAAINYLRSLVKDHRICGKRLGLEKGSKACFQFQIKRCPGACVGKQSAQSYNQELSALLSRDQLSPWPFNHPVALIEASYEVGYQAKHIIDNWSYKGFYLSAIDNPNTNALKTISDNKPVSSFNRDDYHIIKRAIHQALKCSDTHSLDSNKSMLTLEILNNYSYS
ncbi:MAG: hypothetical protein CL816_04895 [Coxiellaceae bacterium]|nr:hypothetical protein [Coxiellaceae bacterium]